MPPVSLLAGRTKGLADGIEARDIPGCTNKHASINTVMRH